jgi:type IV fimbrial biogenesis protein FimT
MSLIELMVGIAIVAVLFAMASPSFSVWIKNSQIRTSAEAIQNGLMLARSEAVRRNTTVRFQLTSTLDGSCTLSTSGTNWVVSLSDPTGACGNPSADPGDPNPPAPAIIQVRAGAQGSNSAAVAAGQSTIVFNGLGRVTPVPAGNVNIAISNPFGGNCATLGGQMRCLQVVVSPGGQVRMCDPMFALPDPQGC